MFLLLPSPGFSATATRRLPGNPIGRQHPAKTAGQRDKVADLLSLPRDPRRPRKHPSFRHRREHAAEELLPGGRQRQGTPHMGCHDQVIFETLSMKDFIDDISEPRSS